MQSAFAKEVLKKRLLARLFKGNKDGSAWGLSENKSWKNKRKNNKII